MLICLHNTKKYRIISVYQAVRRQTYAGNGRQNKAIPQEKQPHSERACKSHEDHSGHHFFVGIGEKLPRCRKHRAHGKTFPHFKRLFARIKRFGEQKLLISYIIANIHSEEEITLIFFASKPE